MQGLVEQLCRPGCLPRNPGTVGGAAAVGILRAEMEHIGLEPAGEHGYDQPVGDIGATNLIGAIPGTGDRYVVLGAHHDACWEPNPGADDNAAGVAVALEVARNLADTDLERSVIIALFDAEEPPYFLTPEMGSQWFVDHATVPINSIDMMVCLDLVGHALGPVGMPAAVRDSVFVLGAELSPGTGVLVDDLPEREGIIPRRIDNYIIDSMSDYDAFMKADIPFLFYSCGRWEHYHAETDTPDRLDYDKMAGLVEHLTDVIAASANLTTTARFDAEGVDDEATLATVAQLLGAFGDGVTEVSAGLALVATLTSKLETTGCLSDIDRFQIRYIIQTVEAALA